MNVRLLDTHHHREMCPFVRLVEDRLETMREEQTLVESKVHLC